MELNAMNIDKDSFKITITCNKLDYSEVT